MTSQNPRTFTSLRLDGVPPFHKEGIEFVFDPRANVFIGPNSTGKSTILREMAFRGAKNGYPEIFGESGDDGLPKLTEVPHIYLPPIRTSFNVPHHEGYEFLYGSTSRECLPAGPAFTWKFSSENIDQIEFPESIYDFQEGPVDMLDYWWRTHEADEWLRWQPLLGQEPWGDFDPELIYWAMEKLYTDSIREGGGKAFSVRDKAYDCCRSICKEVLLGVNPQDTLIEGSYDPYSPSELNQAPRLEFGTSFETPDTDRAKAIHISDLSTGTQGLYVWIWYMACRIAYYYEFDYLWERRPAILFVDEIENHLHPTWQRRVIPALLEHFPGLQIFATTHSPFVVAGLKKGQVHRLFRESNIVKTDHLSEEEREERLVGYTVEDILRHFMNVFDPTDESTAWAAATLRWLEFQTPPDFPADQWKIQKIAQLRENPERTEDEKYTLWWLQERGRLEGTAEEWKSATVEELRLQVSPDLEHGGPFALERKKFLQELADLLSQDDTPEDEEHS